MIHSRPKTDLGFGRSAGFTLVELAVVVAIIGVLAATAGVQYLETLQRVRVARAIIELRAIAVEFDLMGDDLATLRWQKRASIAWIHGAGPIGTCCSKVSCRPSLPRWTERFRTSVPISMPAVRIPTV